MDIRTDGCTDRYIDTEGNFLYSIVNISTLRFKKALQIQALEDCTGPQTSLCLHKATASTESTAAAL